VAYSALLKVLPILGIAADRGSHTACTGRTNGMDALRTLRFTPQLRVFAVRLLAAMLLLGYSIMYAAIGPE